MKPTVSVTLFLLALNLTALPSAFSQYRRSYREPEKSFVVGLAPFSLLLRSGKSP